METMNMTMDPKALVELAAAARKYAYAPYSGFKVGAALLCKDGSIYTGCNIENAAYTPTNCAERTAFFKAVSEGKRGFAAMAVVGGKETLDAYCPPCGVCRQVMMEFCKIDFQIILGRADGEVKIWKLADLLPEGFGPGNLSHDVSEMSKQVKLECSKMYS